MEETTSPHDNVNLPCDVIADCARRRVLVIVSGERVLDMDEETAHRLGLRLRAKSLSVRETSLRSKAR